MKKTYGIQKRETNLINVDQSEVVGASEEEEHDIAVEPDDKNGGTMHADCRLSRQLGDEDPITGDQPEVKMPPTLRDPGLPKAEEVDSHNVIGHVVYRSWCETYIDGQGREDAH